MSAYTSHVTRLVSGPGGLSSQLLSAAGRAISHCPPRALRVVGSLLVDGVHRLAKGGWSTLGLKDISSGQGGIRRDHREQLRITPALGTVQHVASNLAYHTSMRADAPLPDTLLHERSVHVEP